VFEKNTDCIPSHYNFKALKTLTFYFCKIYKWLAKIMNSGLLSALQGIQRNLLVSLIGKNLAGGNGNGIFRSQKKLHY
jgi:hypothetical protein